MTTSPTPEMAGHDAQCENAQAMGLARLAMPCRCRLRASTSPSVSGQPTPGGIPNMDAPFDAEAAAAADRAYDSLTDAEYIHDEAAFTKAYTFAAHRSARHLRAMLAENARLRSQLAEARAEAQAALDVSSRRWTAQYNAIRAERDSLREERDRLVKAVEREVGHLERDGWRFTAGALRRALATAPPEAPAGLPGSPETQDRGSGDATAADTDVAQEGAQRPREACAEPDVDEFVNTPAGQAWLAGVTERAASRPAPVPDTREQILARLQPDERRDDSAYDELDEALAGAMSAIEWAANHVSWARSCARSALATAERERNVARVKHLSLGDGTDVFIDDEVYTVVDVDFTAPGAIITLRAALGSTPDTGSAHGQ